MFKSKKQLLPKDLAARAQKMDSAKVEAEVLRILSAKPKRTPPFVRPLPSPFDSQQLPAIDWQQVQQQQQQNNAREARLLQQFFTAAI